MIYLAAAAAAIIAITAGTAAQTYIHRHRRNRNTPPLRICCGERHWLPGDCTHNADRWG